MRRLKKAERRNLKKGAIGHRGQRRQRFSARDNIALQASRCSAPPGMELASFHWRHWRYSENLWLAGIRSIEVHPQSSIKYRLDPALSSVNIWCRWHWRLLRQDSYLQSL